MYWWTFLVEQGDGGWPVLVCFVFGAIVSATDPVAVVSLMEGLGVPVSHRVLIEGESLLNDGAAIFTFGLLKLAMKQSDGGKYSWGNVILLKLFGIILSALLGYVLSRIAVWLFVYAFKDTKKQLALLFCTYCIGVYRPLEFKPPPLLAIKFLSQIFFFYPG